ncbi:hypothetical protein CPB84DRAFT_1822211 [Gymnopilus junonius]|uniref:Arrestin-like N-terminal domain-containing protein n=1 Tax=Gymnopilus junonius TaxID=109634 RepID=A0A9P5TSR6_GYMJU|nr:hypothetical protein CPB84DRAFT_1822211 [Gymnopilus junonius]
MDDTAPPSLDTVPPSYLGQSDIAIGLDDGDADLPSYTQSQQPSEAGQILQLETKDFDYKLEKNGEPFLTLTLSGNKSFSSVMAAFLEGFPVKGKVSIETGDPQSITAVVLSVKGLLVTGGANFDGYTFVFLDQDRTLWPQEAAQDKTVITGSSVLPFSFDLPEEVPMVEKKGQAPKMFRLPQTFNQRFTHATIKYDILVKLVRKGFLRSNDALSAPFAFIPLTTPPPLPPLRRLAYQEGTPLLGPKVDPDGWHHNDSVQIQGVLFNNQSAKVECKLFLSKPLSYTRGSIIPLCMTLESDDKHALDLLSAPKSIAVRVRRRIRYAPTPQKLFEASNWRDEVDHSQRAVWWPATNSAGEVSQERFRILNGELHLKPIMTPTSTMGMYKLEYSVVLLPFDSPGFKPVGREDHVKDHVLLEQPITIVTAYAPGPRPRATTPANYEPDAKRKADELQTDGEFSRGFY